MNPPANTPGPDPGGDQFAFGENWSSFLSQLDRERVQQARDSLRALLAVDSLEGKRFLDLGSGSGLFSLAAYSLGARVTSVDRDAQSIACTGELRRQAARWLGGDASHTPTPRIDAWEIRTGSVLDEAFMESLGAAEIVYSWGVLHHTGDLREAMRLTADRVCPGGSLAIAIYNDQGGGSRRWRAIKRGYHRLPSPLRPPYVALVAGIHECKFAIARLAAGRNPLPFADWHAKKADRGMSVWHDWVDWIGGLPFEVAKPEAIIVPLRQRGFVLENLRTVGSGWGCNEYLLRRCGDTITAANAETANPK